jgi:hypothetical protein
VSASDVAVLLGINVLCLGIESDAEAIPFAPMSRSDATEMLLDIAKHNTSVKLHT